MCGQTVVNVRSGVLVSVYLASQYCSVVGYIDHMDKRTRVFCVTVGFAEVSGVRAQQSEGRYATPC
eukprot:11173480-Lingulodinium_polyedra.AAC.1